MIRRIGWAIIDLIADDIPDQPEWIEDEEGNIHLRFTEKDTEPGGESP